MKQLQWRRGNGTLLQRPIEEELLEVLRQETATGHQLKVCIGTDSQVKGPVTEFATVVACIRKGKGGFLFFRKQQTRIRMKVKERMLTEVSNSVELAFLLQPVLSRCGVALEVHADINTDPQFKSQDALKEAMGYISGMGFVFRAKPQAFASSSCADRLVH